MVLIALLSAWVASRGAGTLTPVRLKITLAAVPQRAFTVKAADAAGAAYTYLSIRNLSGAPDELVAVRTPVATPRPADRAHRARGQTGHGSRPGHPGQRHADAEPADR